MARPPHLLAAKSHEPHLTVFLASPGAEADHLMAQLDKEVAFLRTQTFAASTRQCHKSQLKCYMDFCTAHGIAPIPASTENVCRYIAFLCRSKTYSSILQYMSVIRLLHLEAGLPHPYAGNYHVSALLKGVKRVKGNEPNYKMTLSIDQLRQLKLHMDTSSLPDSQLWAMITACFFGLLRIGNVTVPNATVCDPALL